MSSIRVNARLFRAAYNCVSTEETRYYLNGVFLQRHAIKGVLLVATDGHRLVVIHDELGCIKGENQIVRLDKAALAACKALKSEPKDRYLLIEDNNATVHTESGQPVHTSFNVTIDGTFPDWTRIARPNVDETAPAGFNPKYLTDFGKIAEELKQAKGTAFTVAGPADGPALIRFNHIEYAYGVLMPVRLDVDPLKVPSFMDARPEPETLLEAAE